MPQWRTTTTPATNTGTLVTASDTLLGGSEIKCLSCEQSLCSSVYLSKMLARMDDVAKARLQIDRVIEGYLREIVKERNKLNELIPVSKLPVELLTEVFSLCVQRKDDQPLWHRSARQRRMEPVLVVTQVCHRWRVVAVASSKLWSTIIASGHLAFVEMMLTRSQHCALEVDIHNRFPADHSRNARAVFGELHRLRHLSIPQYTRELMLELVPRPVPLLKSLALARDLRKLESSQLDFSNPLERCELPCLESLRVDSVICSWTSPLLRPSLTHLRLFHTVPRPPPSPFSDILDILESMPRLQDLELLEVIPTYPPVKL